MGWPLRKALFVEVDQDLSVDQEGKLLSWMVEFLLWLSRHETFLLCQERLANMILKTIIFL